MQTSKTDRNNFIKSLISQCPKAMENQKKKDQKDKIEKQLLENEEKKHGFDIEIYQNKIRKQKYEQIMKENKERAEKQLKEDQIKTQINEQKMIERQEKQNCHARL